MMMFTDKHTYTNIYIFENTNKLINIQKKRLRRTNINLLLLSNSRVKSRMFPFIHEIFWRNKLLRIRSTDYTRSGWATYSHRQSDSFFYKSKMKQIIKRKRNRRNGNIIII